jgi:hypothetical protein
VVLVSTQLTPLVRLKALYKHGLAPSSLARTCLLILQYYACMLVYCSPLLFLLLPTSLLLGHGAAAQIAMPALSPTMTAGNIAKWMVKPGDKVVAYYCHRTVSPSCHLVEVC